MKPVAAQMRSHLRAPPSAAGPAKLRDAARQFEGILLRQMLGEMQKTTGIGGAYGAGGQLYASLVTEALADAILRAGGLGLTDRIAQALDGSGQRRPETDAGAKKAPQDPAAPAVHPRRSVPSTGTVQVSSRLDQTGQVPSLARLGSGISSEVAGDGVDPLDGVDLAL
jgi:Rod binding domain-containing protein